MSLLLDDLDVKALFSKYNKGDLVENDEDRRDFQYIWLDMKTFYLMVLLTKENHPLMWKRGRS